MSLACSLLPMLQCVNHSLVSMSTVPLTPQIHSPHLGCFQTVPALAVFYFLRFVDGTGLSVFGELQECG